MKTLTKNRLWVSWLALLWAYGSIALVVYFSLKFQSLSLYIFSVFFIAARQHTLYVLNHDASHGNLFNSSQWNKWFSSIFCVFPFLHHPESFSYVLWRRIHILHHGRLFTEGDPNYVGRQRRGDTTEALTTKKLIKNLFRAPFENFLNFWSGQQDYVNENVSSWKGEKISHQKLFWKSLAADAELEKERVLKLGFILISLILVHYTSSWSLLLFYWIIPLYTVYPALLRFMDLTEHNWEIKNGKLEDQSNSRSGNILTFIFLSDLSRQLHWEHHHNPRIPFFQLRAYSKFLQNWNPDRSQL